MWHQVLFELAGKMYVALMRHACMRACVLECGLRQGGGWGKYVALVRKFNDPDAVLQRSLHGFGPSLRSQGRATIEV